MPPLSFGAFERRAGTPLTLNRSAKVAIWVSEIPWLSGMSMADGGAMMKMLKVVKTHEDINDIGFTDQVV